MSLDDRLGPRPEDRQRWGIDLIFIKPVDTADMVVAAQVSPGNPAWRVELGRARTIASRSKTINARGRRDLKQRGDRLNGVILNIMFSNSWIESM